MLKIRIGSNTNVQDFYAEVTDTPSSLISKAKAAGISFGTNALITLNASPITMDMAGMTLEELGVRDGSEGNFLVATVKADSAAK